MPTELAEPATIRDITSAGDHDRFTHIVNEGYQLPTGDFIATGPSVVESMVEGTPIVALCGKVMVPNGDPKRYAVCPTCEEEAKRLRWDVPAA